MKINIKREGGFMGITVKALIDFAKISEEERSKVATVIESASSPKPEQIVASKLEQATEPKSEQTTTTKIEQIATRSIESVAASEIEAVAAPKIEPVVAAQPELAASPEQAAGERVPNPYASQMRDGFSYSFSFKKDGKTVKYTFNDMTAPPQLVELFEKYMAY